MERSLQNQYKILWSRKTKVYRWLYELTFNSCGQCVQTDCACKDRICQHVEEQAAKKGARFPHGDHPKLRFIGKSGCNVPPHYRETCTIFLCNQAQQKPGFDNAKYNRLKRVASKIDWRLMELEESGTLLR